MTCSAASVVLMCVLTMRVVISTQIETRHLEVYVTEVMKCSDITSLSLTLTDTEQKFNYTQGFETRTGNNVGRTVSADSIFCVGGATRAFTAVLLAKLLTKHPNITWDTPIRDIVQDRIDLPYQYLANNLNLKDIFTMRSGLAGMDIVTVTKPYTVDELIQNLRYAPPVAGFREKFIHNEVLFSLLEKVVNILGNDTWQSLITDHIFTPLEMTSTTFLGSDAYHMKNFVKGSVRFNHGSEYLESDSYSGLELVSPAASVCTTANDMNRWFSFLLNEGKVRNRVVVEKAALEATYTAIQSRGQDVDAVLNRDDTPSILRQYSRQSNAIGWINGFYRGFLFVSQDGSIPGYQTLSTIIPSRKLAVYVAFSGDGAAKRFAAKVLLNQLGIDYLIEKRSSKTYQEICSIIRAVTDVKMKPRTQERRRISAQIPRPLEDYVGKYRNYAYGDIHVKASVDENGTRDGSLILHYGLAEYKLHTTSQNNTFQLIVHTRSLWYSTNAEWYSVHQEIFAEFISNSQEEDHKFTSVRIDGFDRHYIPEFSRNAQEPRYEKYTDDYRCSAPVLTAWQWTIILAITAMRFS